MNFIGAKELVYCSGVCEVTTVVAVTGVLPSAHVITYQQLKMAGRADAAKET